MSGTAVVSGAYDDFFRDVASRVAAFGAEAELPGAVVGLLKDGTLAYTCAFGETRLGNGESPTADSVFRIASMTKSFTAAAIMLLRERGALALDDPIVAHLPWTATLGAPPGAPISVRDLLTMNGGFPTDDPWGDRQEPLPLAEFDALAARGLSFTHAPRTGFEYSNLGYALLGRVVSAASGSDYLDFVARELLAPLEMESTCFHTTAVDDARRAYGYAAFDAGLVAEPPVEPGAFSPMGGLHSTVRDIARWVNGFASAWRLPSPHPLAGWVRREMQEGRTLARTTLVPAAGDTAAKTVTSLYGYGLAIDVDSTLGSFVHHSGGYPGFGSHMRWHPASGWGIVALGNRTYAPMRTLAAAILDDAATRFGAPRDVMPGVWTATREAMNVVERLIAEWDDGLADAHFAVNVDLDRPRAERRAAVARVVADIGPLVRSGDTLTSESAAHVKWRIAGPRGAAEVELLLTPELPPRIQTFNVSPVPKATPDS